VRAELVPRNTKVNSECYKGLLGRLRNDVRRYGDNIKIDLQKWEEGA